MTTAAVALDLGGTKTAGGLVTEDGELLARSERPTPADAGGRSVVEAAAAVARDLAERAAGRGIAVHPDLGIGSAGVIDPHRGDVVAATPTIRDWAGTALASDVVRLVQDVPGRPIVRARVVNDVHAHAFGEAVYRRRRGMAARGTMVLVAFGTGVGGAMVVDGKLHVGRHFVAGHIGTTPMPLHPEAEIFAAGSATPAHPQLEDACGGAYLPEAYRRAGGERPVRTAREVFEAGEDDAAARRVIRASAEMAGAALAGLANLMDPDHLVLTGGMASAGPRWWEPMMESYRAVRLGIVRTEPEQASAPEGALLGAAALAWGEEHPDGETPEEVPSNGQERNDDAVNR